MHTFYYLYVHIMLCWEHAISDNKIPFHLTFCHITHRISFTKRDWAWTRQRKKKKKTITVYTGILIISSNFYTNTFLFTNN